ncbi:hypothetical protein RRF57_002123 [Xylaria bambusicola]|uniref:Xylanolytic transcriptional activator regulatory domain-containing protein n=1 Tax=Xylaria bambusicola TaxID=326684 RepID=A0AAN7Z470_9PEZI
MRCLWYAVLTIAIAFSSQFENIRDQLYLITRDRLENIDLAEKSLDTGRVEPTQAWILLVFYEFIKTNYQRGWLSANDMTALYSVDRGTKPSFGSIEAGFIIEEEKRRAFWIAYCMDRIISVCEMTPLTFAEEVIYTHLPCPDFDFHCSVITLRCFLSKARTSGELQRHSKIAECVISTTICGRILFHKETSVAGKAYNSPPANYVARRSWLEGSWTPGSKACVGSVSVALRESFIGSNPGSDIPPSSTWLRIITINIPLN